MKSLWILLVSFLAPLAFANDLSETNQVIGGATMAAGVLGGLSIQSAEARIRESHRVVDFDVPSGRILSQQDQTRLLSQWDNGSELTIRYQFTADESRRYHLSELNKRIRATQSNLEGLRQLVMNKSTKSYDRSYYLNQVRVQEELLAQLEVEKVKQINQPLSEVRRLSEVKTITVSATRPLEAKQFLHQTRLAGREILKINRVTSRGTFLVRNLRRLKSGAAAAVIAGPIALWYGHREEEREKKQSSVLREIEPYTEDRIKETLVRQ